MLVETPPIAATGHSRTMASPLTAYPSAQGGTLADVAALRHALTGASVIDLSDLYFEDRQAVDKFIRLHQFDTDNPLDLNRLSEIHDDALVYLREVHGYRLPRVLENLSEIHDLFLLASQNHTPRLARFACTTLKVMHIIHHLRTREIVYETVISDADLLARLNSKVFRAIDEMRASGVKVEGFATGKKAKSSLITKLLAKRSTLAGQIYDRLRFRVVVGDQDDLVRALVYLMRHLVPFNFVVPGQSQNGLIRPADVARALELDPSRVAAVWGQPRPNADPTATPHNEFSGSTYRTINFVADIPLRIDDAVPQATPAIAIVQAEIQLVDAATAQANDQGENAHPKYKRRQQEHARRRLEGAAFDTEPLPRFEPELD